MNRKLFIIIALLICIIGGASFLYVGSYNLTLRNNSKVESNTQVVESDKSANTEKVEDAGKKRDERRHIYITYDYPAAHSEKLIRLYTSYLEQKGAKLISKNDNGFSRTYETAFGNIDFEYFYAHGDPCDAKVCGNPSFTIIVPEKFNYDFYPEMPGYTINDEYSRR